MSNAGIRISQRTVLDSPSAGEPASRLILGWSHDGSRLACDEPGFLWSPATGAKTAHSFDFPWAWGPDSDSIATGEGGLVTLLDLAGGQTVALTGGPRNGVAAIASPPGLPIVAAAGNPHSNEGAACEIVAWHVERREVMWRTVCLRTPPFLSDDVRLCEWSRDGASLAANTNQCTICVVDAATGDVAATLVGHGNLILDLAWHPSGAYLASASTDNTARIWDPATGRLVRVLEGHGGEVLGCTFSPDGAVLATIGDDGTVRFWDTASGAIVGLERIDVREQFWYRTPLRFHPHEPLLAVVGSRGSVPEVWRVERSGAAAQVPSVPQYANAKVVLVGDTGVGKSGLALVLTGNEFAATDSTHARRTLLLENTEVPTAGGGTEIREVFLWDLAGQPEYRLVHQLHLGEVDVAVVVCDARSETRPLAGVSYWARALQQAKEREGGGGALTRILVVARTDRGSVPASRERIAEVLRDGGFDHFFETSAKTGAGLVELGGAIRAAIDWDALPRVSSTELFLSIKAFLVAEKQAGRLLSTARDLRIGYMRQAVRPDLDQRAAADDAPFWRRLLRNLIDAPETATLAGADLLQQSVGGDGSGELLAGSFDVCIGRVESQALIRRLSFGDYVLLQPELLDAYAASIVNAAREEPDGLGSIAEQDVVAARFPIPPDERIADADQEHLLILATIEELLRREIALREETEHGAQLVFPAQSTRDWAEAPELPAIEARFEFEGPVGNIWSALIVRLSRSDHFRMANIWRTAVTFHSLGGAVCGLLLDAEDAQGVVGVFFDDAASPETRLQFVEYLDAYLQRRAIPGTVKRRRVFACGECGYPLEDRVVEGRRARGLEYATCPVCDARISLVEEEEQRVDAGRQGVAAIDRAADTARDRQANATVVEGKAATSDFDVFLCHNNEDKDDVKRIGRLLKEQGLLPWLDDWELRPGLAWQDVLEETIDSVGAAAVFIGAGGVGPWQRQELNAFLRKFAERGCPVIPVLLPTAPAIPKLPTLLEGLGWVDFRTAEPDPLAKLRWGITGDRPPELEAA